jgi:[NiFe] hydrogenase diaphorase moiety large subunit
VWWCATPTRASPAPSRTACCSPPRRCGVRRHDHRRARARRAQGFVYLRGEYRFLLDALRGRAARRRAAGLLGARILGRAGFDFDIAIHVGAGAYVCGEESALIESLEGKRGTPRIRPPFPVAENGYLGLPTVVNNVETFCAAAHIALHGGAWWAGIGTRRAPAPRSTRCRATASAPACTNTPSARASAAC